MRYYYYYYWVFDREGKGLSTCLYMSLYVPICLYMSLQDVFSIECVLDRIFHSLWKLIECNAPLERPLPSLSNTMEKKQNTVNEVGLYTEHIL